MSSQKAKHLKMLDMLHMEIPPKTATEAVGVSLTTVYNVRSTMKMSELVTRKAGSRGGNKKWNEAFLEDVKDRIKTMSMRRFSVEFKCQPVRHQQGCS